MAETNRPAPSIKATLIGQLSLVIWAVSACGVMSLTSLPPFQILSGIFLGGFAASATMNTVRRNWKQVFTRPKSLILAGIFGIVGNDICYIIAFKHAPAIPVDLIVCLWPMLVLVLASIVLSEDIRINHVIACLLAFSGVVYLLNGSEGASLLEEKYMFGYGCALMSAIVWSIYIVMSRKHSETTPELFAIYCGVGFIFSAPTHFIFETTIMPTLWQGFVLVLMGVSTHSLAYYGWDFAIKKGHFKMLSILPYGNPIISVFALGFFGFAELTPNVVVATLMVFSAGIIGGAKFKARKILAKKIMSIISA